MLPRILSGVAALILVGTAAFHATGYSDLVASIGDSSISGFFRRAIPWIWLFFSWHLIAIALAAAWASVRASHDSRPLLTFCAFVTCIDTMFVFALAGFFSGVVLLLIAAVCLVIAAMYWPLVA